MSEEVKGDIGFNAIERKKDKVTKEECMFQVDAEGNSLPEEFEIEIYDRAIEQELIEEAIALMKSEKQYKSISKVVAETKLKHENECAKLKRDIDNLVTESLKIEDAKKKKESDIKVKELREQLRNKENIWDSEYLKHKMQMQIVVDGIDESKTIIQELKKQKEESVIKKTVELMPCTVSESMYSFEKGKCIDGKDSEDWVSDLISKKCYNPKFTLAEAKLLKPSYKSGIKESIMLASEYKPFSYRDIISKMRLLNKPLSSKK